MFKFNSDLNFADNFELALGELGDTDLANILRNRLGDLLRCGTGDAHAKDIIITDFQDLINKRVKSRGDKSCS